MTTSEPTRRVGEPHGRPLESWSRLLGLGSIAGVVVGGVLLPSTYAILSVVGSLGDGGGENATTLADGWGLLAVIAFLGACVGGVIGLMTGVAARLGAGITADVRRGIRVGAFVAGGALSFFPVSLCSFGFLPVAIPVTVAAGLFAAWLMSSVRLRGQWAVSPRCAETIPAQAHAHETMPRSRRGTS